MAMAMAVEAGAQAALMAPTEVLAQQHWQTLEQYLANSRVRRAILTGSLSPKTDRAMVRGIGVAVITR